MNMKTLHKVQQQQQPSLSPIILGSAIDPQQASQGRPHVLFSVIVFYLKSYSIVFLINMSFFITFINVMFGLPLPFFVPST
jgi:hypothetical protein